MLIFQLFGVVHQTIVRGQTIFKNGAIKAQPGIGKLLL